MPSPRSVAAMSTSLSLARCFVQVHDAESALPFYRDALGLEVRNDVAREDHRWITLGAGNAEVVVTNFVNGGPGDGDALAALLAKGALNGVHFHTDDLEGTFERVRASGAEVVQEPDDRPWGVRDAAVRDPAGNLIRIEQAG